MPTPIQPSNLVVILINANVTSFGATTYTAFYLSNGLKADNPVVVKTGDRVGWFVRVIGNNLPDTLPYAITFANPALFGTTSLQVPQGGGSTYLTVLPHTDLVKTKYTLSVVGLSPAFDPDLQTDGSGLIFTLGQQKGVTRGASFAISWLPDTTPAVLTCTKNGTAQPFPLTVNPGDTVQFTATGNAAPPQFAIVFQKVNRFWESPFDPGSYYFQNTSANGKTSSTDNLTVGSVTDDNKVYNFYATKPDGSATSNIYTMTVVIPAGPKVKER